MRGQGAKGLILAAVLLATCSGDPEPLPSDSFARRAARRAYEGAPPVIGHGPLGGACESCHGGQAIRVPRLGVAPPSPHGDTPGMRAPRCRQCHVFRLTGRRFRESRFEGVAHQMRRGDRLYPGAPPTIPHRLFMREDCLSCHDGPAARAAIRTSHPERRRCRQCHVPAETAERFGETEAL